MINEFGQICGESSNSQWNILVGYHYGWLLDALGETSKSAEVFKSIVTNGQNGGKDKSEVVVRDISEYAKIQYAILLSETSKYNAAQKVLDNVTSDSQNPHIVRVKDSVKDSLRVLEREVGTYEIKK